jgi:hypothetical protein
VSRPLDITTSIAIAMLLFSGGACADEAVDICFNYGCASEVPAFYTEVQLQWIRSLLAHASSAERERDALALAVGQMYAWAGQQTPVWRDKGGNFADGDAPGRMDCIDHSTTTTRFLRLLEARGWLRFHRVLEPARRSRFFFVQHFAAQIEVFALPRFRAAPEQRPTLKLRPDYCDDCDDDDANDNDDGKAGDVAQDPSEATEPARFVIDSWFVDNGKPAVVLLLEPWLKGGGPDV